MVVAVEKSQATYASHHHQLHNGPRLNHLRKHPHLLEMVVAVKESQATYASHHHQLHNGPRLNHLRKRVT
jgi:hypothetical protein